MAGTSRSIQGDIKAIKNLLGGAVNEFFIVKELLQNADDATRATTFALVYCPGLPQANHPLLRTPQLIAVNDGEFAPLDSQRIRNLNHGTKTNDASKIGKFGIGLKTVFARCEAFFYLAPTGTQGSSWYNPWDGDLEDTAKLDWDADATFTPHDQVLMRQFLIQHLEPSIAQGFAIWIPLRQKNHARGQKHETIGEWFYEPTYLDKFQHGFVASLAACIPLLEQIERIVFRFPNLQEEWVLNSKNRLKRNDLKDRPMALKGQLLSSQHSIDFYGSSDHQSKIREVSIQSDYWPKTESEKEKASPQGAALFLVQPTSTTTGTFKIDWAVFLPVGQGYSTNDRQIELPLPIDVTLRLHGYWFIAPDRRHLYSRDHQNILEDSEDKQRRLWNDRILKEVTLPRVLPALALLSRQQQNPELSRAITKALRDSEVFDQFHNEICTTQIWLYVLKAHGGEWQLTEIGREIYQLPFKNAAEAFELLPTLSHLVGEIPISLEQLPKITPKDWKPRDWSFDQLLQLGRHME